VNPVEEDYMNRVEWEETGEDEDGMVGITLALVSNDKVQLARARRAFRYIIDDSPHPELRSINGSKPEKEK
jgi:hypothetical protein